MLDHQSASDPQWPLTGKAAMYTRGATHATRTHIPLTDDGLVLAQERGYTPEQITIYEDVGGVSGKTPILSHEGLRALVIAIQQGSIQTVVVADESRLFQEADMLQISLFLKACFEHDVIVVTSQTVYDFTNPVLVARFRSRCRQGRWYRERQVQKRVRTRRTKKRNASGKDPTQKDEQYETPTTGLPAVCLRSADYLGGDRRVAHRTTGLPCPACVLRGKERIYATTYSSGGTSPA